MTQNDVYQEIVGITQKLIELGLSVQQNFPYREGVHIMCKEGADLSPVLKDLKYHEKYNLLDSERNYNIKLLDGALVQYMYTFNRTGRELESHRLAYFPAPHLENYEDNPDGYEMEYFGGSEFHDIFEYNVIKTPLRFDYSSNQEIYKDIHHPYCHLHLGEYETCRIPATHPITPVVFTNFILRNFYNSALRNYCEDFTFQKGGLFDTTISNAEKALIHVNI